jgi:hypothetical protein
MPRRPTTTFDAEVSMTVSLPLALGQVYQDRYEVGIFRLPGRLEFPQLFGPDVIHHRTVPTA